MKIALASDHRGTEGVSALVTALRADEHDPVIVFECSGQSCDYPDAAWRVAQAIADGRAERGILLCGSGIGMSIAANKVDGVRAALAQDAHAATMSRLHNDANVLCLSAERHDIADIVDIARTFIDTEFEGGRHARRVEKMNAIERGEDPTTVKESVVGDS